MNCNINIQYKKNGNLLQRLESGRVVSEISLVNVRLTETPQGLIVMENGNSLMSFSNRDNRSFVEEDGSSIDVNADLYDLIDEWRTSAINVTNSGSNTNDQMVSLGSINVKLCSDNG